jgi:enoyl-CoA hydratase
VPDGQQLEAALALARDIAVNDPAKVSMVKQAINRTFDIMGMGEALAMGVDTEVRVEALETPEGKQFRDIARKDGLKAALAWRDSRFPGG